MSMGAEVIHLGHNRSVDEVVTAALQEDVQGIAISSYQGGHVEYFKYAIDLLRERGGEHIQVFGGGGGVIVPAEIQDLQSYGVTRVYSPEDGQRMGLQGMIGEMIMRCDHDLSSRAPTSARSDRRAQRGSLARPVAADHRAGERQGRSEVARAAARARRRGAYAGPGDHRHRGCRQVQPDRRDHSPHPTRPGRRPAHRRHQHRPVATQERRRASRRPHPDERHRPVAAGCAGVHALARDARHRQRDQRGTARRARRVQGRRLRPGDRRDLGHRPGRRCHRAAGQMCPCT